MITKTNNNAILFDAGKSSRDHTLHNGAQYLKIESEDFKKKNFWTLVDSMNSSGFGVTGMYELKLQK